MEFYIPTETIKSIISVTSLIKNHKLAFILHHKTIVFVAHNPKHHIGMKITSGEDFGNMTQFEIDSKRFLSLLKKYKSVDMIKFHYDTNTKELSIQDTHKLKTTRFTLEDVNSSFLGEFSLDRGSISVLYILRKIIKEHYLNSSNLKVYASLIKDNVFSFIIQNNEHYYKFNLPINFGNKSSLFLSIEKDSFIALINVINKSKQLILKDDEFLNKFMFYDNCILLINKNFLFKFKTEQEQFMNHKVINKFYENNILLDSDTLLRNLMGVNSLGVESIFHVDLLQDECYFLESKTKQIISEKIKIIYKENPSFMKDVSIVLSPQGVKSLFINSKYFPSNNFCIGFDKKSKYLKLFTESFSYTSFIPIQFIEDTIIKTF